MSSHNISNLNWIEEELVGIDLGDTRLNQRVTQIAKDLSDHPSLPINHACTDWAAVKGAYRFFKNKAVKAEKILEPHIENTKERISKYESVVIVQDTSMIDFTKHFRTIGLGDLGGKKVIGDSQGLIMHTTLALTEKGLPLGLLSQQIWPRKKQKVEGHQHAMLSIEQKESVKWLRGLRQSASFLPETKITMVCDREADIYDFFSEAIDENINLVVRLQHDRVLYDEESEDYIRALDLLGTLPKEAEIEMVVPGNGKRRPRLARLEVRYSEITFTSSPRNIHTSRMKGLKDMTLWMVEFREVGVRKGIVPLHWVLLTTDEVKSSKQAISVGSTYRMRWEVELYFKTLKTGCGVERCRLEAGDRLIRYLNVMSIVAWRILWMTWLNRIDPTMPADLIFSEPEWKSIWLRHYVKEIKKGLQEPTPPEKPMTIKEAIRWMAMRAGFLGRKCDGEPGMITIWRGWLELIEAAEMYEVLMLKKQNPHPVGCG